MLILGLDPALGSSGWGVVDVVGNRIRHIANGQIKTDARQPLGARLVAIEQGLAAVLAAHTIHAAALEEVFVNENPQSTLKLAQARGVALLCAARAGLDVGEYAPRLVKKSITGLGNATKDQVRFMVERLLPGVAIAGADAADALAIAITHAHGAGQNKK
ncbi:MAG: crossover junction endodeoxyribonuclease RuvC [Sphingopyxis sp.]